MQNQKEARVFTTVTALVDKLSDNPAARLSAQEILARLRLAETAQPNQPAQAQPVPIS